MMDWKYLPRFTFCCKNELIRFKYTDSFNMGYRSTVHKLFYMSDFIVKQNDLEIYGFVKNRVDGDLESRYLHFDDVYMFMRDNFKKEYFGIKTELSPRIRIIYSPEELAMFIKISEF